MQSCSLRKIMRGLGAALLALCLLVPQQVLAAAPGGIDTESALRKLIENAKDGDTLLVDDIDFAASGEPIVINKSITLRTYKEHGSAIWSGGAFILDGSAGKITVTIENIIFYSTGDAAVIMDEVWDAENTAPPALTVLGSVDAALSDCVFRNYISREGANICAVCDTPGSSLNLSAANCSFLGSAVCERGGAIVLVGQEGGGNVRFTAEDCAFAGNISSNRKTARGGGAIYAENAVVELSRCSFTSNEASHQYLLKDPAATAEPAEGEETQAAPSAFSGYQDKTKGGAVYAVNSSLTMKNCTVTLNSASLGGGIALDNSSLVFFGGILAHNHAESAVLQEGVDAFSSGTGMGGGLYVAADKEVRADFINSSIYGNSAIYAYGGLCLDGAGTGNPPFTVNLVLCTYADNSAAAAFDKPEVDRSKYFPKEDETGEKEDGETDPSQLTEEEKKKLEEEQKKAEEAMKAAEAAYEQAQKEALDKVQWISVPGNIWGTQLVRAKASLVIDETFSSLKRNKVAYPFYEQPSLVNNYVYYASPETALTDGYLPNVPSAEFTHVSATQAFREAFPALPADIAAEALSPYFDEVIGDFYAGDNASGGLVYELYVDGVLWMEIEAEGKAPEFSVPGKDGYYFTSWKNEDGTDYVPGATYITGPAKETRKIRTTLLANTYTLHFVSEAGTQDVQQVYGAPLVLPAASEKKNYRFTDWYRTDGNVVKDGEIYSILGDSTYVAQYTKEFPKTAVIALSAAIAVVALYLIIARISDAAKKAKVNREIAEAEAAARAEEEARLKAQQEAAAEEAVRAAEQQAQEAAVTAEEAGAVLQETAEEAGEAVAAAEDALQETAEDAEETLKKAAEAAEAGLSAEMQEAEDAIAAATAEIEKNITD